MKQLTYNKIFTTMYVIALPILVANYLNNTDNLLIKFLQLIAIVSVSICITQRIEWNNTGIKNARRTTSK